VANRAASKAVSRNPASKTRHRDGKAASKAAASKAAAVSKAVSGVSKIVRLCSLKPEIPRRLAGGFFVA
jgi:hypothetical protein